MSELPTPFPSPASPITYIEVASKQRNSFIRAIYVDDILVNLNKAALVRDSSTQTDLHYPVTTSTQTSPQTACASTQSTSHRAVPNPEDFSTEQLLHLFKYVYPQTWGKKD